MTIKDIINAAHKMSTSDDLLNLLNRIKRNELGDKAYPYSMYQLHLYCNPNRMQGRYHEFKIPKKHNKGVRLISAPNNGLKRLQMDVKTLLEAIYTPSPNTMGFIKGKSVVDNARHHLHQNYVLNIDLQDFFPSIVQPRVWKRLQLPPFSFNKNIASIIAGICCIKEPITIEGKDGYRYVLPQGAPTSPVLSNAVCEKLDRRLRGLSKRFNVNFTRYADDITFSGMRNVFKHVDFKDELRKIIEGQNFKINDSKTRIQVFGSHQEVTGLTVGEKVNVSKQYVRSIRSLLHIWERYGYDEAYKKYWNLYLRKKLTRKNQDFVPPIEAYLTGKLNYLKMVKGTDDSTYIRLNNLFLWLVAGGNENKYALSPDIHIIKSWNVSDFEKTFLTRINVSKSSNGNIYWSFTYKNEVRTISCQYGIKADTDKSNLQISQCRRTSGHEFFLAHYTSLENNNLSSNLSEKQIDGIIDTWNKKGIEKAKQLFASWCGLSIDNVPKDLDFIGNLSRSQNSSDSQRSDIQKLMLNDLQSGSIRIRNTAGKTHDFTASGKRKEKLHNPQKVQEFLQAFSRNDTLKYTTHLWEKNDNGQYRWKNFNEFYSDYYAVLFGHKGGMSINKLYEYNRSLHNTIYNFLLPHRQDNLVWDKTNQLSVGFCYPENVLSSWMDENQGEQPFYMPLRVLPENLRPRKRIKGKMPVYFMDLVNVFKHDIRVNDDELYYIFRIVFNGTDYNIDMDALETIRGCSFYTDVYQLTAALKVIESNISNRPSFNKVVIKAKKIIDRNNLVISITQVDSFSDRDIADDKLTLNNGGGQLGSIKNCLQSLCDFSVISRFRKDGVLGNYEIKYLFDENFYESPKVENYNAKVDGFTYLLTFYIV